MMCFPFAFVDYQKFSGLVSVPANRLPIVSTRFRIFLSLRSSRNSPHPTPQYKALQSPTEWPSAPGCSRRSLFLAAGIGPFSGLLTQPILPDLSHNLYRLSGR
jgi:hypothetical protein